jgi:hypothetical protein
MLLLNLMASLSNPWAASGDLISDAPCSWGLEMELISWLM